jgi:hypothetical protein
MRHAAEASNPRRLSARSLGWCPTHRPHLRHSAVPCSTFCGSPDPRDRHSLAQFFHRLGEHGRTAALGKLGERLGIPGNCPLPHYHTPRLRKNWDRHLRDQRFSKGFGVLTRSQSHFFTASPNTKLCSWLSAENADPPRFTRSDTTRLRIFSCFLRRNRCKLKPVRLS